MRETYVFINDKGNLELDIVKYEGVTSFDGEIAENYIKIFYDMEPKEAVEEGDNLIISYSDEKLILEDPDKIFKNMKNRNLFAPIFEMTLTVMNEKNIRHAKKRKVKRKNKYTKNGRKKIMVSLAVALILSLTTSTDDFHLTGQTDDEVKDPKPKTKTVQTIDEEDEAKEKEVKKEVKEEKVKEIKEDKVSKSEKKDKKVESEKEVKKVKKVEKKDTKEVSKEKPIEQTSPETAYIDYDDRSDSDKAVHAQKYEDVIKKYSDMYGLDAKLMLAIATQERGEHSSEMDSGGATGLMQIQNSVWLGESIKAYNFETGDWETVVIDQDMISSLEGNVKAAAMIMQSYLKHTNYNICQSVQSYNMGPYAVDNMVRQYCSSEGKNMDDVRANQGDFGWLVFRDNSSFGDPRYLEHVLSYCGDNCQFTFLKPESKGTAVVNITNQKENVRS